VDWIPTGFVLLDLLVGRVDDGGLMLAPLV
jgi:hypothetical protein